MPTDIPVLVVEDDSDTSELIAEVLDRAGYDVACVESGADALAFLGRAQRMYLVLLDLHMDDMNGWEVLAALRRTPLARHAVAIVTGSTGSLPAATPSLRKPFTSQQLLAIVEHLATAAPPVA